MRITARLGRIFEENGGPLRGRKGTKVDIRRGKEDLSSTTTTEPGTCQVRSGTKRPCLRSAAVKIRGVPFCEPCAREQEAYFAVGELTEEPWRLRDERLGGVLSRMRQTRLERGPIDDHKPDAA
jgi:hypothetical protein